MNMQEDCRSPVESRVRRVRRGPATQRSFSQRLIETQEDERKRIAAELHDSLGQDLLVIKNRALLGLQDAAATPRSVEQFDEISRLASAALSEVRQISRALRPYQIDRLGLTRALQSMVTSVAASSGVRCDTQIDGLEGLLEAPMEIHFYRIVQELLSNVIKHSRASRATVWAEVRARKILLVVQDDGCGFDPAAFQNVAEGRGGMGLDDVAERVRILKGAVRCESQPAAGTCWSIEIPVAAKPG